MIIKKLIHMIISKKILPELLLFELINPEQS